MEGKCEDCQEETIICVTCNACVKCHALDAPFCLEENGKHKHYKVTIYGAEQLVN